MRFPTYVLVLNLKFIDFASTSAQKNANLLYVPLNHRKEKQSTELSKTHLLKTAKRNKADLSHVKPMQKP